MKKLKKHGGGGESSEEESNPTLFFFSFFLLSSLILSLSFSHPFPLSLSRPFHPSKQKIEQEGCVCQTRWVPPGPRAGVSNGASNAAGGAANNAHSSNPFRLAVPCPADLSWHDVVCLVKDAQTMQQKQVLHPCSGIAVPGETVALMGPSGAGKSTLLDVLAGRKTAGKLGGGVKMNGRPCGTLFKRISAYVAQEDVFVPTMTAWETLVFHATLTLPKVRWS